MAFELKKLPKKILDITTKDKFESTQSLNNDEVAKKLTLGVEYVCEGDVDGDIAEFGVGSGRTAIVIASALKLFDTRNKEKKRLYLFDSFEGLPEADTRADSESPHVKKGIWGKGTCKFNVTVPELTMKLNGIIQESNFKIFKGWFNKSLPLLSPNIKLSMIHVDCDLYKSAIDVLDYCFCNSMIQEGTAIFFDDYNCNRASKNYGERKAWSEITEKYSVEYSDSGDYAWAGKKFIVHSYKNPRKN
jgi:hypothetical protein